MSKPRLAAVVCEGPTDVPIFREIILELWPTVEEVLALQPELDAIGKPFPGKPLGWSQVRAWCERNASAIGDVLDPAVGERIDLLVIAVDVDIAVAAGIGAKAKEVGAYETKRLHRVLKSWLNSEATKLDSRIVFSTPVRAVEAWVLAALFRQTKSPETILDPAKELANRGRLRRRKDGKPLKDLHVYREFAKIVASRLKVVRKCCPEAERTCRELESRQAATREQ